MQGESAIICGARSGRYPLEIRAAHPELALTVHAYDCHQARKIREDLAAAGVTDAETLCSARLPEGRLWDRGFFFQDDKLMSAELRLCCMQDLLAHVPGGEKARVDGIDRPTRRKVLERVRDFSCDWISSVPGGPKMTFTSLPGCFCHRRPDTGGLALAETVAAETNAGTGAGRAVRLLDMGCGCGLVGFLVAGAAKGARTEVTFVDSSAIALEAVRINAARFAAAGAAFAVADILLSDTGTPPDRNGTFDVFAGNPPYYGDWKIAELFLETAARALRPGGTCYTVAKNPEGLLKVQSRFFAETEILKRRGYAVLKSIRRG